MGPRRSLAAIAPYAKTNGSRQAFVRLDLNENRFDPAPGVLRALRRLRLQELAMYPESDSLRLKLAQAHGLEPENVLLAGGGDQAIRWVFEALVETGAMVAWAAPTFSIYTLAARLRQARVRAVPFAADFQYPGPGILSALERRPALLVLVSPNNPTGTVVADEELRRILKRAGKTPVLLDEAYGFFSGRDHAAWINEFPNLLILNSFSKSFALAGLRIGYLLGGSGLLAGIEKVALPYPLSAASIQAGLAALADIAHARRQALCLQRQKKLLINGLLHLGIACRDTAANFILARFDGVGSVWEKLRQGGILTKNLDHEPQLAGYLRVTVGRRRDNQRLLKALAEILPVQAVLFDMDGVLVDASASYDQAVLWTVAYFCGRKPLASELRALRLAAGSNNDWQAATALLAARNCRVAFADIVTRFQRIYLGADHDGLSGPRRGGLCLQERWLPGASLLPGLAARYSLGIVTGRPRAEAQWTLKRFGVERFFKVLVGAEDTGDKPKPHPCGIRQALRRLGVRRAVYLGDRIDDMLAARAAGVRAVAVWPAGGRHAQAMRARLLQAGAGRILGHIDEIMEVLHETGNDPA